MLSYKTFGRDYKAAERKCSSEKNVDQSVIKYDTFIHVKHSHFICQ